MNLGYVGIGLGILGLVIGGAMYASDWHKTIGLGGIALGIVLLIAGAWLSRSKPMAKPAPMPGAISPSAGP